MWWGFGGNAKIASHQKTEKHIKIFKILQINLLILSKHPNKQKKKKKMRKQANFDNSTHR